MDLIRATLNCSDGIDDTQPAILMPMPVKPNAAALFFDDVLYKLNYGMSAIWS